MATNNSDTFWRDQQKEKCIKEYKNMTRTELEAIRLKIVTTIGQANEYEGQKMLGEMDACNHILEVREFKQNEEYAMWDAMRHWEKSVIERRKKAILQIPAAISYHGQLIAAVLDEEDNLSAEEIRQWSNELATLDNSEYQKLLDDLCEEKVLYINDDGNYSLLSLCTEDLFPTNPLLWTAQHCSKSYTSQEFLEHLAKTRQPATEVTWIELCGNKREKENLEVYPQYAYSTAKRRLEDCIKTGILTSMPIPDTQLNYYYFTMLGEERCK